MQNQPFRVAILTPYLSEDARQFLSQEEVAIQAAAFGYDPANLRTTPVIEAARRVELVSPSYRSDVRTPLNAAPFDLASGVHLVIAGSTETGEREVRRLKDVGLLVARYSIFYGGPSEYTRNLPEESGYALDIPKQVSAVKALLTHAPTLDALLERDPRAIRRALEDLNGGLETPILATPYLDEVLRQSA